jgi:glycosyltransferase involved in cell wall biosynthesis
MLADDAVQPVISCIVPCKGAATLPDLLRRLVDQDLGEPYEIVVVDGFHDDEVAAAVASFPGVRLVRSRAGLVPGPARNLGAEHARAEYLTFTDADCIVDRDYVRSAKRALDDGARLAGGPILDALPWWQVVASIDNYSQFAEFPATRPAEPAEYLPACNLAIRKQDFAAVGRFKDTGIAAGEDTLLCFAVNERWPDGVRFVPTMRVYHRGRHDLSGFLKHQSLFGYCRGSLNIKLTPRQRALGRSRLIWPGIMAKRALYMTRRTLAWRPAFLIKVALLSPIYVAGLLAYCVGFRRACRAPVKEAT